MFNKTQASTPIARLTHSDAQIGRYRECDDKGRFFWELLRKAGSGSAKEDRPTMCFPLFYNTESDSLRFPIKLWNSHSVEETELQEKKILNLGADILDLGVDIPSLVRNKIVVIGDFSEDDIHDTYIGKVAGPVININALEALRNNELEIPWTLIVFLMVLYTIVCYLTIRQPMSTNKFLEKLHMNTPLVRYLLSFVGFSFLFSLIGGGIYLMSGMDINIILPALWFTLLRGYTNTFAS